MKTLLLIACLLFPACSLPAAEDAPQSEAVSLTESAADGLPLYHIEGRFEVDAPRAQVWGVLTDYSALKGVVSSMQASCVVGREGNTVLVDQVARGKFLFFRKTIRLLLKVEETPKLSLSFKETSGKPFRLYHGSWKLEEADGRVTVIYKLNVSQSDMAPVFIERGLFKDNALSLLRELKAEIERRAAVQAGQNKKSAS